MQSQGRGHASRALPTGSREAGQTIRLADRASSLHSLAGESLEHRFARRRCHRSGDAVSRRPCVRMQPQGSAIAAMHRAHPRCDVPWSRAVSLGWQAVQAAPVLLRHLHRPIRMPQAAVPNPRPVCGRRFSMHYLPKAAGPATRGSGAASRPSRRRELTDPAGVPCAPRSHIGARCSRVGGSVPFSR